MKWFRDVPRIALGYDVVTFVDHGTGFSLPDPKFFAIHAALAQILYTSGAAEVLDDILTSFSTRKTRQVEWQARLAASVIWISGWLLRTCTLQFTVRAPRWPYMCDEAV